MKLLLPTSAALRSAGVESSGLERPGPPLAGRERALLGVTATHLCFLPWALGTMHPWSQFTSLGLALTGAGIVLLPRAREQPLNPEPTALEWPGAKLARFPVFWAGLILLTYFLVQAINPAWRFQRNEGSWWLEALAPVTWLPTGVEAPFARSNPWRALMVGAALWLLVCSVWAGFTRRRSYHLLFTLLAGNAVLLAVLGVLQKLSGAKGILWAYVPSNAGFLATFIYPNHASPYFNLMIALTIGLAWRHYQRAHRRIEPVARARLLTLGAVVMGGAVLFSYSRAAIVLLAVYVVAMGAWLGARRLAGGTASRDHPEFLPLAGALTLGLGLGLGSLRAEKLYNRFAPLVRTPAAESADRSLARQATVDMFHARWLYGWGAGCFRYGFPLFARNYPGIYGAADQPRLYWEYAHSDWLQFPAEVGVAGLVPTSVILGWGTRELLRRRFWRNPVAGSTALGATLVLAHAWVDFVFQNPAVLFTWSVLFVAIGRWVELDRSGSGCLSPPARSQIVAES